MFIADFIWLPDIVEKIAIKHRVGPDEVEDIFQQTKVQIS
jgi:hypothetical protein